MYFYAKSTFMRLIFLLFVSVSFTIYSQSWDPESFKEANTPVFDHKGPINPGDSIYEAPSFPGGKAEMYQFLGEELRYPQEAQDKKIEGKVYLKLHLDYKGEIVNIAVSQSAHPILDNEAIRCIKLMPDWVPASLNGEMVNSIFILPINFTIHDKKDKKKEKKKNKMKLSKE